MKDIARTDYLRETAQKLTHAKHGEKGNIIAKACDTLQISRPQLYRELEAVGFTTERKTRSDKGKTVVPTEVAEQVGAMVHLATRANGKKTLPISTALEILQADGKAPKVSPATISRIMKQKFCHPSQLATPTAHIQQRSLHPNHVWQIDASVCVIFYLPKGGMQVMDEKKFYKNKPHNLKKIENERVIRYVITDHYSGWVYVEYVAGSESSENLTQVFLNAIQIRGFEEPMHGVPFILYADKGCANTSGLFKNLMERLDITFIAHATGNSRAKGQVENANNIVETQFEGRFKFLNIESIEHLNALAKRWRVDWNEHKKHSRTKRTRNEVWRTIAINQLRKAPPMELCKELVSTVPVERTVRGNLTISHSVKGYGQHDYDLRHIDGIYPKAKVSVVVNPYRTPCVDVIVPTAGGESVTYTVEPMQTDWVGFDVNAPVIGQEMRAMPNSEIDNQRNKVMKAAYGVDTLEKAEQAIAKRAVAYDGKLNIMADIDSHEQKDYMPLGGEKLSTPAIDNTPQTRKLAPLNWVQTAKTIRAEIGDLWTAEHYLALQESFPTGEVPQEVIGEIIKGILEPKVEHHEQQALAG
ncbi:MULTISPECIES: DDE-type integrase/transposase/recombinase [Moraxella]|uniref:Integrase n=1 Tax=Moraxella lacunata TaxID=477 RepID=A0A1B8Q4Y8_MORLA|nr:MULTISPECIES: DDE-type integrase/transposase/recombinase [Moraxella]MBE9577873.1 transposase family protein [Moraxella sp. K1664]MBE9587295.1 transposase family protein [Moraxella sp. K1630]MBE9595553.1 transposase family protein [Moraxella sp. K2450]MDH9218155.1 DDE-type integrase/transposase/recombinase [Moraxella lacunata]MDI4481912.1 transposase [Moraxella lacunata]